MSTATVSASSYCVAVLHAAAHPACPCTGVLLGRVANGAAVSVVSSLPLLHTPLGVSTQLEVALLQAEAFAASQSLVLVGVYHAPAHAATTTVPPAVIKIADKLQSVTGSAVVLLLDAAAFEIAASEKPMPCFQARAPTATVAYCTCVLTRETQLFVRDAGRWRASSRRASPQCVQTHTN